MYMSFYRFDGWVNPRSHAINEVTKKRMGEPSGPARGRVRTQIVELLTDKRCSQAVLDFLATTDVGRASGPAVAADEDGAASEASEWDAREHTERAAERAAEEEWLGAAA